MKRRKEREELAMIIKNEFQEAAARVRAEFEADVKNDDIGLVGLYDVEAIEILANRATPMKPVDNGELPWENLYCPVCWSYLHSKKPLFCECCGQALNWSDDD